MIPLPLFLSSPGNQYDGLCATLIRVDATDTDDPSSRSQPENPIDTEIRPTPAFASDSLRGI